MPRTIAVASINFTSAAFAKEDDGSMTLFVRYQAVYGDGSRHERERRRNFTSGTVFTRLDAMWTNLLADINTAEGLP